MNPYRLTIVLFLLFTSLSNAQPVPLDKSTRPGDVIDLSALKLDFENLPRVPLQISKAEGPQYLLSDKPEYFRTGDGIALQELVKPGTVRLYVYHVPTPGTEKKTITAIIENKGDSPLNLRMLRRSFPAPGGDYHKIGKAGLIGYYTSTPETSPRTVAPGARLVIDPEMDKSIVGQDILVHGLYEFEIDQPALISVFQKSIGQDSLTITDTLSRLPLVLPGKQASGAGRGLFLTSNYEVTASDGFVIDTARGVQQLVVADGKTDPWLIGRDSITADDKQINKGNYGVMYKIKLTRKSTGGKALAVVMLNARADSKWCKYCGAAVEVNDGLHPGGAIPLPREQVRFEGPPQAAVIQTFAPVPEGRTETIEITYSPPGASCLPTPILFVPFDP